VWSGHGASVFALKGIKKSWQGGSRYRVEFRLMKRLAWCQLCELDGTGWIMDELEREHVVGNDTKDVEGKCDTSMRVGDNLGRVVSS
jgi:hypothetical protein